MLRRTLVTVLCLGLAATLAVSCKKKETPVTELPGKDKKAVEEKAPEAAKAPELKAEEAAPAEAPAAEAAAEAPAAPAEAPAAEAAPAEAPAAPAEAPAEEKKNENHLGRDFVLPAAMMISDVLADPKYYNAMADVKLAGLVLAKQDQSILIGNTRDGITNAMLVQMQDGLDLPWAAGDLVMVEGKLELRKWDLTAIAKSTFQPPAGDGFKTSYDFVLVGVGAEKLK